MPVVQVPSVWPPGSNVSITGQVTTGDGHVVGASSGVQFGTLAFRLTASLAGGLPSAQAFGVVAVSLAVYPQTVAVGGVASSQAFGPPPIKTQITIQVPGVPSPYPPYIPSITGGVICGDGHVVGGIGGAFGFVTIHATITRTVGGVASVAAFGSVWIVQIAHPTGVPSAGEFGWRFGWKIMGPGVLSSAEVGVPEVFIVWVRPEECTDLDLAALLCTDLVLTPAACTDLDLDVLVPT